MQLTPLLATKESLDIKKGGLITYETDITTKTPGIILLNDEVGDRGMIIVNQVHVPGPVKVMMKPASQYVKKYNVGDVVGFLATFDGQE